MMTRHVAVGLVVVAIGCTAAQKGTPAPAADAGSETQPDVSLPGNDAVDELPATDAVPTDVAADGPKAWPPPGMLYLTRLESEAQYDQLRGTAAPDVEFIIRRRGNDVAYPYPWDSHECVFEKHLEREPGQPANVVGHFQFLLLMDPARAVMLYYGDAKTMGGSLIPGRIAVDKTKNPRTATVLVENTTGLDATNTDYPLDATIGQQLRERIARCVPFITAITVQMVCPGGRRFDCPLP